MYRVVVVDDEPITRMDIKEMLREKGADVIGEASDGFDAVELCRNLKPDVVIMDVKMPVFDGLTAAETITKENLAGTVVMLTAFVDSDIVEAATKAGVGGYLVKPVEERMIMPAIEVALANSRRLQLSDSKAKEAEKRLEDERLIRRAQGILAKKENISEDDAYKKLRTMSMEKRIKMVVLAKAVLEQDKKRGTKLPGV